MTEKHIWQPRNLGYYIRGVHIWEFVSWCKRHKWVQEIVFTIGSIVLYCSVSLLTATKRKSHIYKYSKEEKNIQYVTYEQEEQKVIRERLLINKTEYTDLTYEFISHSYSQYKRFQCGSCFQCAIHLFNSCIILLCTRVLQNITR